jgi:hypothetical protein
VCISSFLHYEIKSYTGNKFLTVKISTQVWQSSFSSVGREKVIVACEIS